MALVDMQREEGAQQAYPTLEGCAYPYGLCLRLDMEELAKLGIDLDKLPTAGNGFHLEAMGVIKRSATEDPDADGDIDCVCLELQITHMALEHEAAEAAPKDHAKRMYGKREEGE